MAKKKRMGGGGEGGTEPFCLFPILTMEPVLRPSGPYIRDHALTVVYTYGKKSGQPVVST